LCLREKLCGQGKIVAVESVHLLLPDSFRQKIRRRIANGDPGFRERLPLRLQVEERKAFWGGYSLVDAELRGIKELLKMSLKWEFFINLSGQDFPLKSNLTRSTASRIM